MATVRKRDLTLPTITGSRTYFGQTGSRTVGTGSRHTEDVVGNYPLDNPFYTTYRFISSYPVINGGHANGTYNGYPCLDYGYVPILPKPGDVPSDSAAVTTVAAATNPSRPHVDLPVFIGELRDLPHMVKETGDFLLGRRGSFNGLSWTFGWEPLIRDLWKLFNFQEAADKRFKELNALHKRGIRRNRVTWSRTVFQEKKNVYLNSDSGAVVVANLSSRESHKQWVSIKWSPSGNPFRDESDIRKQALASTFGLTARPKIIWDLMPWSWMIDWFSNVGDYLQAVDNSVAFATSCCVMYKIDQSVSGQIVSKTVGINCNAPSWVAGSKNRTLSSPALSASAPILSARQLSILGGLATSRFYGR